MSNWSKRLWAALLCAWPLAAVRAELLVPHGDEQVIETLPAAGGQRAEERRLRREWAAHPGDERLAVALARRCLDEARSEGDPRRAGQALAALQAWPDAAAAPDEVLLMRATIAQYLHDFDGSARDLLRLVQRRPDHAQAWLTLATVRRVQGRYAESDAACAGVAAAGAGLHAQACRAENDGLRGRFDAARAVLERLCATPRLDPATRAWLTTTLAELEARAGRPEEAEAAYRVATRLRADGYTVMSFADFLSLQGRDAEAMQLLREQPRTDAVLLRLAIAGVRSNGRDAARDAQEVRERMRLAELRPDVRTTHAREHAMFALWVDHAPQRALQLARIDVRQQREPLDLIVLAQAARATGDEVAQREAERIAEEMGLHDERLDTLR